MTYAKERVSGVYFVILSAAKNPLGGCYSHRTGFFAALRMTNCSKEIRVDWRPFAAPSFRFGWAHAPRQFAWRRQTASPRCAFFHERRHSHAASPGHLDALARESAVGRQFPTHQVARIFTGALGAGQQHVVHYGVYFA